MPQANPGQPTYAGLDEPEFSRCLEIVHEHRVGQVSRTHERPILRILLPTRRKADDRSEISFELASGHPIHLETGDEASFTLKQNRDPLPQGMLGRKDPVREFLRVAIEKIAPVEFRVFKELFIDSCRLTIPESPKNRGIPYRAALIVNVVCRPSVSVRDEWSSLPE
jgi:hypothetical protein